MRKRLQAMEGKMKDMEEMLEKGFEDMHCLWKWQEEETKMPEMTGTNLLIQIYCKIMHQSANVQPVQWPL